MMSDPKVVVAVEKAVHDALREVVQTIWNQHGICVQGANFSWVDVSTPGRPEMILTEVRLDTLTK